MTLQEFLIQEFGDDPSDGVFYSVPMYTKIWNAAKQSEREKYQELIAAAEAVIARLEMPKWNDAGPTAKVIYQMRDVIERMKETKNDR